MYDIPAGVIAVIVLVGAFVGMELAFRWGRRANESASDDAKGHLNIIQTSTLGILALLLAFTFSLSLQRFESRSDAVVDEANAIGTAYLRAQLLPVTLRGDVRRLLRDYVDLRVRAGTVATNEEDRLGELVGQAAGIQDALWEHARRSAEIEPNPVTSGLFIQALNEMIDSFGRRDATINRHVPEVVLFLLLGTFVMTVAIVGFGAGVVGQRPSWVTFAMVALIVVLVLVILDLDRPRRGLIVVSEKNLLDLQGSMKKEVATLARPPAPAAGASTASGARR
jgi:prepilin signal peptidase PulO-like enzyme (type II secretory pathway)